MHRRRAIRIVIISLGSLAGLAALAKAVESYMLEHIGRTGGEQRVVFQLDAPYGSVDVHSGALAVDVAMIETLNEDGNSHSCQWSYGVREGGIGMLRIGVGTDEGMKGSPPIAMWQTHSGFSPARALAPQPDWARPVPPQLFSFSMPSISSELVWGPVRKVISTDGGTVVIPESRAGTRISLARNLPMEISANLGFGESMLDLTGLSITSALIETGAARATICSREQNPVPMRNCNISSGMGLCTICGISNFNSDRFGFKGAFGSYHLGFDGKLTHNMDAVIELGVGVCTISIPPTACRVRIFYEDGLLTSFDLSGLVDHHNGYATSPGFNYSTSPILTLHLSSGAGKMSVNYH